MLRKILLFVFIGVMGFHADLKAQGNFKDAQVDVTVTDFKKNLRANEIVIFKSQKNGKEFDGTTSDMGKFSVRLPAGDKYDIFIYGFKDSVVYNVLDIPALKNNESYKSIFKIDLQFQPSKTFVLEDCNFETGKANLEPESYAVIDELIAFMTRKEDEKIELGGHTDNVGKPAANLKLSQERAEAVRAYMIAKGIAEDRIMAKGYGSTVPIADNKTEEGRAQNRRTEVKLL